MNVPMWIGEGATLGTLVCFFISAALLARAQLRRFPWDDPARRSRFLPFARICLGLITVLLIFTATVQVLRYTGRV